MHPSAANLASRAYTLDVQSENRNGERGALSLSLNTEALDLYALPYMDCYEVDLYISKVVRIA